MQKILLGKKNVIEQVDELVLQPQSEVRDTRVFVEQLGFQIIQEDFDRFTIHLVVDEKIPELCEKFVQYIGDERLKKASYEFVFSKGLFPDLTGKRSYFKPMERRG